MNQIWSLITPLLSLKYNKMVNRRWNENLTGVTCNEQALHVCVLRYNNPVLCTTIRKAAKYKKQEVKIRRVVRTWNTFCMRFPFNPRTLWMHRPRTSPPAPRPGSPRGWLSCGATNTWSCCWRCWMGLLMSGRKGRLATKRSWTRPPQHSSSLSVHVNLKKDTRGGQDETTQRADNQHVGRVILGTACCGECCLVSLKSS